MNKIKHFAFLAFLAASSGLLAGTATKEYVDRRDLTIAVAATNYTDAAVAAVGGVTRETVTNIAEYVTGNATNGLPEAIASKYTKPAGGIPATDIAAGVIPVLPTAWSWVKGLTDFPSWITDNKPPYTAAEVHARPDTWMPSAADVGARANTWMPSAEDIPGAAYDYMTTAFNFGTGSSITEIAGNEVYIGIGDEGFLTVGTLDYGGTLTVAGTNVMDAISAKFDSSKTNDLLSVAMSATTTYVTTNYPSTNTTDLVWHYGLERVTIPAVGTDWSVNTNGWAEGRVMFTQFIINPARSWQAPKGVTLEMVDGEFPTNNCIAVTFRFGDKVYMNIIKQD